MNVHCTTILPFVQFAFIHKYPPVVSEDKLYGRINVDPVQNLGNSFALTIEKVFLCSGKDGYIPKYDPDNLEFGCIAESPNLQYTFKILVSL